MNDKTHHYKKLSDVPEEAWQKISKKKIFFGHQSVGNNIIAGIEDILNENSKIAININLLKELNDNNNGFLAHEPNLGKNDFPETKIKDFYKILDNGLGNKIDIASMKFCFVDIDSETDIEHILKKYKEKITSLKREYPKLEFIHFTVPLLRKNISTGLKAWIKKILGKNDGFFANEHNIARNKFNELIRNEYCGREPLFDLAEIESTFPDGTRCTFEKNGIMYYALVPEYTNDGGHLNDLGRKKVAEKFLLFLTNFE